MRARNSARCRPSGQVLWCRETMRVTGRRTISGVLTDITLRKQLEEQLLTAERSDALHGLASRLAHDLNNPLMIITGYSEEMLANAQAGGSDARRRGADPERDRTDFGHYRSTAGLHAAQAAAAAAVDVAAVIAEMEEKHRACGGGCGGDAPGSEPVWAMADAAQIEEMILALVSPDREDARSGHA